MREAVVMFCGPFDEGPGVFPTRRVDVAIEKAASDDLLLILAGDATQGRELAFFERHARARGHLRVQRAYDAAASTLSDAQAVARLMLARELAQIERLHLATDWWHMERAQSMLRGEVHSLTGRSVDVYALAVTSGPTPHERVLANEARGLQAYLNGTYNQERVFCPLRGRWVGGTTLQRKTPG